MKDDRDDLFRREVIAHRSRHVNSSSVLWRKRLEGLLWLATVLVLLMLIYASTQLRFKETVSAPGILQSANGSRKVFAPTSGTIQEVFVRLGDEVNRGDRLASISTTTFSADGEPFYWIELERLNAKREHLLGQRQLRSAQFEKNRQHTLEKLEMIRGRQSLLEVEAGLFETQLKLSRETETALLHLYELSAISKLQLDRGRNSRLEKQQQLQRTRLEVAEAVLAVREVQANLDYLQLQWQTDRLQFQDQLDSLESDIDQLTNQQSVTVLAASSGIVSEISVSPGTFINPEQPLMVINEADAPLLANIYAPSSIAGRVTLGQEVMLRYDAFDFQEFGRYAAAVSKIGKARLDPRETLLPILGIREPVYLIQATLEQQSVTGSREFDLLPEAQFVADFVMEEMTLLHYVFKPLKSLRGRVQWKRPPVIET